MTARAHLSVALLPVVALLIGAPVRAQQIKAPRISINPDRDPIVRGEAFELTVTIATESSSDPEVRLPQFTGFRVLRQSESHPMSFSFSFGFGKQSQKETKRQSIYSFVMVADRAGKYVIDPVIVKIGNQQFKSDPYSLTVVDRGGSPSSGSLLAPDPHSPAPLTPMPTPDPTTGDQVEVDTSQVDPDYFIQLHVSKERATVGELIVLTAYLYTSWRISDIEVTREPGTEGFWVENLLTGQRRLSFDDVEVAGKRYERAMLRKMALFPIKPGEITIAPVVAQIEVKPGGFFSRRKTVNRTSPPVTIEVIALPSEDQPKDFDPANVGRYNFGATIDRKEMEVGEPITLTMTARGEGNLRNISLPTVKQVEGFKVYEPDSEVDLRPAGSTVMGLRTSRVLMIPKEAGTFTIPSVNWSYFDPAAGEYRTLSSPERRVKVRPSSSGFAGDQTAKTTEGSTNGSFERLNRKLRSILSRGDIETGGDQPMMTRAWFLVLAILAPVAYLGVVLASRARRRMAENRVKGRSKRAGPTARRRLSELYKRSEDLPSTDLYAELERILTRFLEDRLETAVAGDTLSELRARLVERGLNEEQAAQVVTEMETCDFARFARSSGSKEERHQGLQRIEKLIAALESVRVTPPAEEAR